MEEFQSFNNFGEKWEVPIKPTQNPKHRSKHQPTNQTENSTFFHFPMITYTDIHKKSEKKLENCVNIYTIHT